MENDKPTQSEATPSKKTTLSFSGLAAAAGTIVCLFTLTGFLGGWFWMFELTSHFRIQYTAILMVLAFGFFCIKRWRVGAVFLAFGLLNGRLLLPFLSFADTPPAAKDVTVKLLAWNVNSGNESFGELKRLLDLETPDIVLLMEVSSPWERFLETSPTNYSHQQIAARDDNFGIALLSKPPLANAQTLYLGDAGVPSIRADLATGETTITLLGTHPLPPAGSQRSRLRDQQLRSVATWANQQTNPVVIVGDLNSTPWSPVFQEFIKSARLKNSAEWRGLDATWPAFFSPMLIPIDHFLHTEGVVVVRREILEASGSDHLPQVVEFRGATKAD